MLDTSFKVKVEQFSRKYPRDGESNLVVIDSDGDFTDVDGGTPTGTGQVVINFYTTELVNKGSELLNICPPYPEDFRLKGIFEGCDFLVAAKISGLLSGVTAVSAVLVIEDTQLFSIQNEDLFVYKPVDNSVKYTSLNKDYVYKILFRSTLSPFEPTDVLTGEDDNSLSTATYKLIVTLSDGKQLTSNIIESTEVIGGGIGDVGVGEGEVEINFYNNAGSYVGFEITNTLNPYSYAFNLQGVFKGCDFQVWSEITGLAVGVTPVSAILNIVSEQNFSRQNEDLFVYNILKIDNSPYKYKIMYRSTLIPFEPDDILSYGSIDNSGFASNILSTATYKLIVTLSDGKQLVSNIIDSTEVVQSGCCW